MDVLSMMLGSVMSEDSLKSIEKKTGVAGDDLKNVIGQALPMMLGSMTENASSKEGAESLLSALQDHKSRESVSKQLDKMDKKDAEKIVGHILGKDSDRKAQQLADNTGLSLGKIMPVLICLAPLLMSGLSSATTTASQQQQQQGGGFDLSDGLDLSDVMSLFGGGGGGQSTAGGSQGSLLGSLLGGNNAGSNSGNNGTQLLGTLLSMMK